MEQAAHQKAMDKANLKMGRRSIMNHNESSEKFDRYQVMAERAPGESGIRNLIRCPGRGRSLV